ncbi:MAG: hypothetical protein PSN34_08755 [Urechidicola sp.]|nr:hypothetical protein [Urechidicola sp.]
MILKDIQKNLSHFWAVGIILIYSLLMAEYFNSVSKLVTAMQGLDIRTSIYSYIATFNYFLVILISFAVWLVSSFLFHMFAILLGENEVDFKNFIKYTGVIYVFPAIGFVIALFMFETIELPKDNALEFLKANKSMISIGWIINISSSLAFILVIPIIKHLYKINWLKAFGAVIIPIASIYLLGKFFSEFVL